MKVKDVVEIPAVIEYPPVSIIIPCLNEEKNIAECLDAVFNLDYPDFEVVVVDNGSTDATRKIAARYPVRIVIESKKGFGSIRNRGIHEAKSDYILYISADCLIMSDWLKCTFNAILNNEVAGVGGRQWALAVTPIKTIMGAVGLPFPIIFRKKVEHIPTPNALFRKNALLEIGGFDETLITGEDVDLNWRLQEAGYKLAYRPQTGVKHKVRETTRKFFKQHFNYGIGTAQLLKKYRSKVLKHIYLRGFLFTIYLLGLPVALMLAYFAGMMPIALTVLLGLPAVYYMLDARRKLSNQDMLNLTNWIVAFVITIAKNIAFSAGQVYGIFKSFKP